MQNKLIFLAITLMTWNLMPGVNNTGNATNASTDMFASELAQFRFNIYKFQKARQVLESMGVADSYKWLIGKTPDDTAPLELTLKTMTEIETNSDIPSQIKLPLSNVLVLQILTKLSKTIGIDIQKTEKKSEDLFRQKRQDQIKARVQLNQEQQKLANLMDVLLDDEKLLEELNKAKSTGFWHNGHRVRLWNNQIFITDKTYSISKDLGDAIVLFMKGSVFEIDDSISLQHTVTDQDIQTLQNNNQIEIEISDFLGKNRAKNVGLRIIQMAVQMGLLKDSDQDSVMASFTRKVIEDMKIGANLPKVLMQIKLTTPGIVSKTVGQVLRPVDAVSNLVGKVRDNTPSKPKSLEYTANYYKITFTINGKESTYKEMVNEYLRLVLENYKAPNSK